MPTTITDYTGGVLYPSALIGDYQPQSIKVDISALSNTQVDAGGYLKPGVLLNQNGGQLSSTASGVAQVETLTPAGTATGAGTALVTVTGALIPGGSKTVPVAYAGTENAAAQAALIVAALGADTDITGNYTVSGTSTVVLTAKVKAANDASLNMAIDVNDVTGATSVTTSANTTAGVDGADTQVPVVTIESIKVAADNSTGLSTATDVLVACAVSGNLNRDVMEDNLGRALTATEISACKGPNSNLSLSLT